MIVILKTSYENLSIILISLFSPYIDEIIGDHQYGFRRNRSATDQVFRIHQALEKMGEQWDSTSAIHRFQESLYFSEEGIILIEFWIPLN
jgi:hypothetical protein